LTAAHKETKRLIVPAPVARCSAAGRPRTLGGLAALPVQLRFCLSVLWKRAFHRRRYPCSC
jgi:hypothetical protein